MAELVELIVKDGPQIGQTIPIEGDECTLGGKGSGADIELSGIPYGVKFAQLKETGGKWIMIEFEPKSILLNDQHLKRRNQIKNGDFLRLPSLKKGQSYRYDISVVTQKKQKAAKDPSAPGMNTNMLIGGGAYLLLMVFGGLYFMMNSGSGDNTQGQLQITEVLAALDADMESIDQANLSGNKALPLTNRPINFTELQAMLNENVTSEERDVVETEFKNKVLALFSEAWRMEQQGKYSKAADLYGRVVSIMVDRHLKTTEIALGRLSVLN